SLVEQDGIVWVGGPSSGILALRAASGGGLHEVARYDRSDAFVLDVDGATVATPQGAFRPTSGGALVNDPALTRLVRTMDSTRGYYLSEDAQRNLWMGQGGVLRAYAQRSTGVWTDVTPPVLRTLRDG